MHKGKSSDEKFDKANPFGKFNMAITQSTGKLTDLGEDNKKTAQDIIDQIYVGNAGYKITDQYKHQDSNWDKLWDKLKNFFDKEQE